MTTLKQAQNPGTSVDRDEVARFEALADAWWDPDGDLAPLHKLNPPRLRYIRDHICRRFGRDAKAPGPLTGLRILDIGCGGGLLCEPMARLGAKVTGADAAEKNLRVAALHAATSGLKIDYRHATAEELACEGAEYDVVVNMEVVEHVADVELFLDACGALVAPGGLMIMATLNRTAKAFALAIVGAEYVLRWLPRGTHDWRKFVTPAELTRALTGAGLEVSDLTGVRFDPLRDCWEPCRDTGVNYMVVAEKTRPGE